MRKSFKTFSLILLLAVLFLPFGVRASTSAPEEIEFDLPSVPTIGAKPTYLQSDSHIIVNKQAWANLSDYKEMKSTDTFEAHKLYSYDIQFTKRSDFDDIWFLDSEESDYYLAGFSGRWDEETYHASIYFYFGDQKELDDWEQQEASLVIGLPQVGGVPVFATPSEKYTIESEKWVNVTDNKVMSSTETFEAGKYYKYTIEYSSYYATYDFLSAFRDSEYFVGQEDEASGPLTQKISGCFYFGSTQDLIVKTGDVTIAKTNPPAVGGVLTTPTITIKGNGISSYYSVWYTNETGFVEPVEEGTVVEVGKTYEFNLSIHLAPGYRFDSEIVNEGEEDEEEINKFEVIDLNVNDNLVSSSIWTDNDDYGNGASAYYNSEFQILPSGATIGIRDDTGTDILYEDYGTTFEVYPKNEANANITWTSSNPSVATVDEYGNVEAVAPGTTVITAKNSLGDTATREVTVGIKATDIVVDQTDIHIKVGQEVTLGGTVLPANATEKEVNWSVSWYDGEEYSEYDSYAVDIMDNVLVGRRPGKALIYANTPSNWGLHKEVIVYVEAAPEVQSVAFTEQNITMTAGDEKRLQVTLTPTDAYSEMYEWKSSDRRIARVDYEGIVTAVKEGTATITVTTDNGKTATCTITVKKKVEPTLGFKDVPETAWYYKSVKEAYTRGIIAGYSATQFGPGDKVTRGQLVTFLWRVEGQPEITEATTLKDIKEGAYYTKAVKWASKNKVVNGYKSGNFGPNDPITRRDLAVILNNYAKYKDLPYTAEQDLSIFADYNLVKGNYSEPALKWAVKNGVMHGQDKKGKKYVAPIDNTTRAEAAAMIVNFLDTFNIEN